MTETEKFIHSFPRMKKEPNLSYLKRLLEGLGNPQNNLKIIHIAGTNGKGSAASYISKILECAGYKCGRYISPFVDNFYERISINGKYITDEALAKIVKRFNIEPGITEFEVITAAAFEYFYEEGCDFAVMEAGIGGKNDATNIIEAPLCSVIMKIGLDHMNILGDTVEKIAADKCGIIKENCPCVTYPKQKDEALSVIEQSCSEKQSKLIIPNLSGLKIISTSVLGNTYEYNGIRYDVRLGGEHQIYNSLCAIEAVKALKINVSDEAIQKGLYRTLFPARMEIFKNNIILDGAHNADGMETLVEAVRKERKNAIFILGVFADKDYSPEIDLILKVTNTIYTVAPPGERALASDRLYDMVKAKGANSENFGTNYKLAIEKAQKTAGEEGLTVITGSLYLAAEIRKLLSEKES